MSRANGFVVGATSVQVAARSPNRIGLIFSVGDSTNASSVVLKDQQPATAANGFPLNANGGLLEINGPAAQHNWEAIRLAGVDCVVGVIEIYGADFSSPEPDE